MKGALPPSSIESFFTVGAHCAMSCEPIPVEPVKDSLRTIGLAQISPPMSRAAPVTTLKTPGGMPARSASSASARAEKGVCVAGLAIIVQPAASAAPALRVIIAAGKFHGVIAAQTPTGSRVTSRRRSGPFGGMISP